MTHVSAPQDPAGVNQIGIVVTSVLTTICSVYPAFLAGALGDELREAVSIGDRFFGVVVGSFFFGAMLGSAVLGRVGERIGARRMIIRSVGTTGLVCLVIAAFVRSGPALVAALIVAGIANSASQTAANKLLGQSVAPTRLGIAMAIKQSGMPGASMLGGLAVPVIALTIGWQWGYAAAAALAGAAMLAAVRFAPTETSVQAAPKTAGPTNPGSSQGSLIVAAVAAGFAAAGAGTLGNWITSSATDAGWSSGAAGLILSLGAISGITARLIMGATADRRPDMDPLRVAARFLAVGAIGAASLGFRAEWAQVAGAVVAFGAGWAWPALFNFGIVRANAATASAATGITQTGTYIGVFTGPVVMGLLVDRWGYQVGWAVIAVSMAIGAAVMSRVASDFMATQTQVSRADSR